MGMGPPPYSGQVEISTTANDCSLIGIWYADAKTCRLTKDLNGYIIINDDGIILDGNSHTVTSLDGPTVGGRTGILSTGVNGIIKNFNLS